MDYLEKEKLPEDDKEHRRVLWASRYLVMDERGRVWVVAKGVNAREVPLLKERKPIIVGTMKQLAFPNGQRLHGLLKVQYYWKGMKTDCMAECGAALPRQ